MAARQSLLGAHKPISTPRETQNTANSRVRLSDAGHCVVITWDDVAIAAGGGGAASVRFQVQLCETGTIKIVYEDVETQGGAAALSMGSTASVGVKVGHRVQQVHFQTGDWSTGTLTITQVTQIELELANSTDCRSGCNFTVLPPPKSGAYGPLPPGTGAVVLESTFAGDPAVECTTSVLGPSATFSLPLGQSGLTPINVMVFDVVFSGSVTGVDASSVQVEASGLGYTTAVVGAGTSYEVTITIVAGDISTATDVHVGMLAGSGSITPANARSTNTATVTYAAPVPTVSLGSGQSAMTDTNVMVFDIVFSSPVTGLVDGDVDVAFSRDDGGWVATRAMVASGGVYTLTLTITGGDIGSGVNVTVGMGARVGAVWPVNAAAATTAMVSYAAPSVSIELATGQANVTSSNVLNFAVMFSSPVTGATSRETSQCLLLTFSAGEGLLVSRAMSGFGASYNLKLTVVGGDTSTAVDVSVWMDERCGSIAPPNAAAASAAWVQYEAPIPTFRLGDGQASPTFDSQIIFGVEFSAAVSGLSALDFLVNAGSDGQLSFSTLLEGSGSSYSLTVVIEGGDTSRDADVSVDIPARVGIVRPPNAAAPSPLSVTYTPPRPVLSLPVSQAMKTSIPLLSFQIEFSSNVTNFAAEDIHLEFGTTSGLTVTRQLSGYGSVYLLQLSVEEGDISGTVAVAASVPARVGEVIPRNAASATPAVILYTAPIPYVTVAEGYPQETDVAVLAFDVSLTHPIEGLSASHFAITTNVTGVVLARSLKQTGATVFQLVLNVVACNLTEPVSVRVGLPARAVGVVPPNAPSPSAAAATFSSPWVAIPVPVLTLSPGQGLFTASNDIRFSVEFSEPVTGLREQDFDVAAGSLGVSRGLVGSGRSYELTLTVIGGSCSTMCPEGFSASSGLTHHYCAKTIETAAPRANQVAACEPFLLATPSSVEENSFLASLRGDPSKSYWYGECCLYVPLSMTAHLCLPGFNQPAHYHSPGREGFRTGRNRNPVCLMSVSPCNQVRKHLRVISAPCDKRVQAGGIGDYWQDELCAEPFPALCEAAPCLNSVSVFLPAARGNISPRNAAALQPSAVVQYAPPRPSITTSPYSRASPLVFHVEFTSNVTGIKAEDFHVAADELVVERHLAGSGRSYTLSVVVSSSTCAEHCPPEFRESGGPALLCARVQLERMSWYNHQAACAPYALTTVSRQAHNDYLVELVDTDAWYVLQFHVPNAL